ncbi:MAG: arginine repressor [Bdellovibrionales bacterium]|nr:arginine repressor [Bdellovibrionales bacterium]
MKTKRHSILIELLETGEIDSQQRAVELLHERGIEATQATVSRDFEEIGAVRVRAGESTRYALPASSSQYGASLVHVLRDFVLRRQASGNMIVLHTPPGHANVVAAAIDRASLEGVLGVVAGDDTLFVCVNDQLGAKTVLEMIEAREREA